MKKIKWYYTVLAFLATLLIKAAGYTFWEKNFNEAPFKEELEGVEAVDEVNFEERGEKIKIKIAASYHPKLDKMMEELEEISDIHLDKSFIIKLEDHPNQELTKFKNEINSALYEAARKGNYREIEAYVEQKVEEYPLTHYRFSVNNSWIYVQAEMDEHYLYILVPVEEQERGEEGK